MAYLDHDLVNRSTWSRPSARRWLAHQAPISDPGEAAALDIVGREFEGGRILDLGIGTGRTIPLLEQVSTDYVGVDYLPGMIEAASRAYPGRNLQVADARDLSLFDPCSFDVVTFSFNGIDAIDHDGRARVLSGVHRVLRPGGVFWFSTLNLDGPAPRERPWRWEIGRAGLRCHGLGHLGLQILSMPSDLRRWHRLRPLTVRGPGWEVAPLSAHHYGVLAHYTRLTAQVTALVEAGFAPELRVFRSTDGGECREIHDGYTDVDYFHLLARRPLDVVDLRGL